MRIIQKLGFLVAIAMLIACSSSPTRLPELQILPSPTNLQVLGPSHLSAKKVADEVGEAKKHFIAGENLTEFKGAAIVMSLTADQSMKSEGYALSILNDAIQITASTNEGLFYGLVTLGQVAQDAIDQNAALPQAKIQDEPALNYRAIHIDVKHHMEKEEYYYELMDRLADLKINGIILEIEDKLAYELQPAIGSSDAWPIEKWRKLSDYAMARNIRISPLVQGLGHASFILKHEEYKGLRDDPASDWAFNPLDDQTYQVQFDLYEDALKAFPHANYLHVGGDEVLTTGRNSGKSELELQLIWLNRVSDYADEKGLTPIFWDDMPLKNAGVYNSIFNRNLSETEVDSIWSVNEVKLNQYVDMFPKNCIYMRWNYDMPETPGNSRAMKWFSDHGFQVMGATAGQTRWNLMPLDNSNDANIRDFSLISIANNADGLLLTLWDDDSPHFELYRRGITIFAEYTWAGQKRSTEELQVAYRQRTFGPELAAKNLAFISDLEGPVSFWKNALLQAKDRNRLRSLSNPMQEAVIQFPDAIKPGEWAEANREKLATAKANQERIESILEKIGESKKLAVRNQYTLEVYEQVAKVAQFTNKSLLLLAEWDLATGKKGRASAKQKLLKLEAEWRSQLRELEGVYSKTRVLDKPDDYILDQDHHVHLANQAKKFTDWQFYVEDLFIQKIKAGNSLELVGELENN